jgi:hypothetical protein
MKRLFLLVLFVSFSLNVFAYRSIFGQSSTEWIIRYQSMLFTMENDTFFVSKDTMVDGHVWKKIVAKQSNGYKGMLREDTSSGKVWYKAVGWDSLHYSDTVEMLAFDFSLKQGDSFDVYSVNYGCSTILSLGDSTRIVDTVYYVNGVKHIQFVSAYDPGGFYEEPLVMIEGIGCNWGVVWKACNTFMVSSHYLLCSYKDGVQTFYNNKKFNGNCNGPTSVATIASSVGNEIEIYPQPANNFLYFKNKGKAKIAGVEFVDMRGVKFSVQGFTRKGNDITIDISTFVSGIYTVWINLDDGNSIQERVTTIR